MLVSESILMERVTMNRKYNTRRFLFILIAASFTASCAHFHVNPPLESYNPDIGYRLKNKFSPEKSDELLLILSFSGGGTRAAAFSYGVLEALADTEISINGEQKRLIDENDRAV